MTAAAPMEFMPNSVAIVYRPEDDVDTLLADFAFALQRTGRRIGGVVQRNVATEGCAHKTMEVIDLMTGETTRISQALGPGSRSCRLDPAGLAASAIAVTRALAANVELVIVNKFSKQEAAGSGLRAEIADVLASGVPLLTAVPASLLDAWNEFTGGVGTTLLSDRLVVEDWWNDGGLRTIRRRNAARQMALAN